MLRERGIDRAKREEKEGVKSERKRKGRKGKICKGRKEWMK